MNASVASSDDCVEDIDDMFPASVRCGNDLDRMIFQKEPDHESRTVLSKKSFEPFEIGWSRVLRRQAH